MNWQQVCADPILQDLPYKIELNEWGQIVMTPASNRHGRFQVKIAVLLSNMSAGDGSVISECSVQTDKGTKVADVAWLSSQFLAEFELQTPYESAPDLCIEVVSPSNSPDELAEKRSLYFDAGAKEVWFCSEEGLVEFFAKDREIPQSNLFPKFPKTIE